jgi:glutamate carboxypeptidase
VLSLAQKEKPALLETLKALTAIESGSRQPAAGSRQPAAGSREPDRIANVLAAKLRAIGGKVELIEPVEANAHRLSDTPYWRILQAASPTLRTHRSRQTHR